ncbi:MAG: DUF1990 domain-containing protein [Nitriliruptoraceae bacterium]|nr:DUF1990 domain-containing protein [Nitriliruptoraceae bacterium]
MTPPLVTRAGADRLRRALADAPSTADPAGGTGTIGTDPPPLPAGHHHAVRIRTLGDRAGLLERATSVLCGYEMHRRAGFRVDADHPFARAGDVVVATAPALGPLGVAVPCRVTQVVTTGDRRGMTLATLPGHPVAGEERFELRRGADGIVRVVITAYSRPATSLIARTAPAMRLGQQVVTRAFLAALRRGVARS